MQGTAIETRKLADSFDAAIAAKKELDTKFKFVLQGQMFSNPKH